MCNLLCVESFSKFSCLNSGTGEVYTWGWKECVPSGKVFGDPSLGGSFEKDVFERQSSFLTEQGTFSLASLS
jgi:hypothetical protein